MPGTSPTTASKHATSVSVRAEACPLHNSPSLASTLRSADTALSPVLRLDIADATAILIEGSIIESVGIPIFLGLGCQGVTITSSYCKHVP